MKNSKVVRTLAMVFLLLGLAFCAVSIAMGVIRANHTDSTASYVLMVVFSSVGIPFLLTGVIIRLTIRYEEHKETLKYTGSPITAKVLDAEQNRSINVNGRSPYRLLCSCEENGTIYLYRSENIWYDPRPLLTGDTVTIYRDEGNRKRYYVDLSEVLPPTQEV